MGEKTISSQVFTKNKNFEVLEKISKKEDDKYKYHVRIKCVKCDTEKIIQASHKERTICQNCKKISKSKEVINEIFGTYKILTLGSIKNGIRYYNVQCEYCNSQSIQSITHLRNNPKSCSNCKYERRNVTPTLDAPRNCVKSTYLTGAKNRNLEFSLSDKEFDQLIFSDCYFCGCKPTEYQSDFKFNRTNLEFKRNGIDRLDSLKGYTKENCVSCCSVCNLMKMTLHYNDFINHIEKIHTYLVNKGSTTISKESTLQAYGNGNRELPLQEDDIVYSI